MCPFILFFTPSKNFFCYGTHALAWILAYILTNTVTDVKYFFIKKGVHEICFELTKQISVILRENPPLRDDVASAACFLSLRHMEGHAFDKCRKFTLSAEALRQIGGKIQKCDFGFFKHVSETDPRKRAEKTFLYYTIYYGYSFRFLPAASAGAGATHPTSAGNGHSFTTYATPKAPMPVWMDSTGPITR